MDRSVEKDEPCGTIHQRGCLVETRSPPEGIMEGLNVQLHSSHDTDFPQQDTTLANGEHHRLLSCLYYHELNRLDRETTEGKKGKETKGSPKLLVISGFLFENKKK